MQSSDLAGSFRSHQNYLAAFAYLAGFPYFPGKGQEVLEDLARKTLSAFPRTGGVRQCTDGELAACLNRAWGTEMILAMNIRFDADDDFVRIANSWGCVQTYYVGYSATQALVVASGHPRPASHPKTQEQAIALWTKRQHGVAPFSFAATSGSGSSLGKDPSAYLHGPGRDVDLAVHPWSGSTSNCWDTAAIALRTTRHEAVDKSFQKARQEKVKQKRKDWNAAEATRIANGRAKRESPVFKTAQLSKSEKLTSENSVRPYGYLDYLYRLRIKANYEQAEMFTEGPDDANVSKLVAMSMVRIATATMIAHETRIAQILGKNAMIDLATRWVEKNSPPGNVGIGFRLPILRAVLQ